MLLFIAVALLYGLDMAWPWYPVAVVVYGWHVYRGQQREARMVAYLKTLEAVLSNARHEQLAATYEAEDRLRRDLTGVRAE